MTGTVTLTKRMKAFASAARAIRSCYAAGVSFDRGCRKLEQSLPNMPGHERRGRVPVQS